MSENSAVRHGSQFDGDRLEQANEREGNLVRQKLKEYFDAKNVASAEASEAFDTYSERRQLSQLLDFAGIDYIVDTLDGPPCGVNHRTHNPTQKTLCFDLRKETGKQKPSEVDELVDGHGDYYLTPKYATRLKLADSGFEWFRIIDLRPLVAKVKYANWKPDRTWSDGDVVAWMFDYERLQSIGCFKKEYTSL